MLVWLIINKMNPLMQNLPQLFREEFYNGKKHVYVNSKPGYRFKCELVAPNGKPIRITSIRWEEFCNENVLESRLLHFIQQGEDTFYVTCYDDEGYEHGFYPGVMGRPQRIVTRVWPYPDYNQVDRVMNFRIDLYYVL